MARIETSIEIKAAPEELWPLILWDKVPQWMDIIKDAQYTSKEKEIVGATAHWVGEAGGVKSEWDTETTEWEHAKRGLWRTTGGSFTGIGGITLNSSVAGTKVTFMMDYELPYSLLGKLIDKLKVYKAIEKGSQRGLLRLKEIAEI